MVVDLRWIDKDPIIMTQLHNPFLFGASMEKLLSLYKRNLQAFSAISQLTVDCGQALSRCNADIVQQNLNGLVRAMESLSDADSSGSKVKASADIIQESWQRSTASAKQAAQILGRSNREVYEVLSQRMQETVSELQDILPTDGLRRAAGKR
jgi:phasin family protein